MIRMKRLCLAVAVSAMLAVPAAAQTVIVVRHAEKAEQSADPVLSDLGEVRAAALAETLTGAGVTHVFVSPLQRTALTAGPAAGAAGAEPVAVSLDGGSAAHVARLVGQVRRLSPEAVVLVVGHSNTVPDIARALGATGAAAMDECEYDRLTVLTLTPTGAHAVTGRYGAVSPPC
jgi:broad specificity phosphatase PhoE